MKIEIEYDELKRLIISESENSYLRKRIDELEKMKKNDQIYIKETPKLAEIMKVKEELDKIHTSILTN